ncbi:ADP-ribosylglycohydrolase family protein [Kitasatospora sp. NPDC096147]|uniref:ADP-ribosylglycohydrolase family protein n=1 Tax=Kitasatospora sp. NPDC096147 TaxID=3364093 RepID=UPI00380C6884
MGDAGWAESAVFRARVRGCLLGGAIGDALGYPVEALSLADIRARYGPSGITELVRDQVGQVGRISDDTQMTLFTAEGWQRAIADARSRGVPVGGGTAHVQEAYLRWLDTQQHEDPPPAHGVAHRTGTLREELWLYDRRAPGLACLSGLREGHVPDPNGPLDGTPGPLNPGSKGCGSVMRSAPFGFTGGTAQHAFEAAARSARITHGHPTGYYAAGALAAMVRHLTDGESLPGSVLRVLGLLTRYPGHRETSVALRGAVDLAAQGTPTPEKVESLGGGWVAEEALAIAVYAALVHPGAHDPVGDTARALLLAVNHSGDSDSTGAICGNLLGTLHGDARLPQHWLTRIEGRAVIALVADDLAAEVHPTT